MSHDDLSVAISEGARSFGCGNFNEATVHFSRALEIKPRNSEALNNLACSLLRLGKTDEALKRFQQSLVIVPDNIETLSNYGAALCDVSRYEEALACFEKALSLNARNVGALCNKGRALMSLARDSEALVCFDKALSIDPDHAESLYNRGSIHLSKGQYAEGFREHLARWKTPALLGSSKLDTKAPLWSGLESLRGKTIILHAEQGLGDTIQFVRYVPLVIDKGGRVVLRVPEPLVELLRTVSADVTVISESEALPRHDYHCPLLNLPSAFGTTVESVPTGTLYLRAKPELIQRWEEDLSDDRQPRIGLCWAGRQYKPVNVKRDMSLSDLLPVLDLDATFVSLQKVVPERDQATLAKVVNLKTTGDRLQTFSDTAALVTCLDLVITVDTSVAHLAAALGRPVWIMNRYVSCWRWLRGRPDSPWYPTVRLFNQPAMDNWSDVVKDISRALTDSGVGNATRRKAARNTKKPKAQSSFQKDGGYRASLLAQARSLRAKGHLKDAAAFYNDLDRLELGDLTVVLEQIGVLNGLGKFEQALYKSDVVLDKVPDHFGGLRCRATALRGLSRHDEAVAVLDRCLGVRSDAEILREKALILIDSDLWQQALECINGLLDSEPADLAARNIRGLALELGQRYEEALSEFDFVLERQPNHYDALNNRGLVLARMGQFRLATDCFNKALRIQPNLVKAFYNRSVMRLTLGELEEGFAEFESRWKVPPLMGLTLPTPAPRLIKGMPVDGKTILLYHEQGYGDSVQFARYVPELEALGAKVVLAVPPALRKLMESLTGNAVVVADGDRMPWHELSCPLLSLPAVLGTSADSIPCSVPYLAPSEDATRDWEHRFESVDNVRVGIAWAGRRYAPINRPRDIELESLRSLLDIDVDWISLQKEIPEGDNEALRALPQLRRFGEQTKDFADLAALISNLDLVITVDTAVAHVAGALGIPVWMLNRRGTCWRWLADGVSSAWYPSMSLFRQKETGQWSDPINDVAFQLSKMMAEGNVDEVKKKLASKRARRGTQMPTTERSNTVLVSRSAKKIKFVCATRLSSEDFFSTSALGRSLMHFREFPKGQGIEVKLFPNNRKGLPAVYNAAIEESRLNPAILVFAHDDIFLSDFYWASHLHEALEKFQIVGISGNKRRAPRQSSWMYLDDQFRRDTFDNFSGVVGHGSGLPDLRELSIYGPPLQEVKILDGVFLATESQLLIDTDLRFDEQFDFDFYDLDFCRQAEHRNIRMGTAAISIIHQSIGKLGTESWRESYRKYLDKYGE